MTDLSHKQVAWKGAIYDEAEIGTEIYQTVVTANLLLDGIQDNNQKLYETHDKLVIMLAVYGAQFLENYVTDLLLSAS